VTRHRTPLAAVALGLAAGVIGTGAMTAWQELSAKLAPSGGDGADSGGGEPASPWDEAPVPAQLARRIIGGVFEKEVSPDSIPLLTNVMHWAYGTGWGAVFGIVAESVRPPTIRGGALFGIGVWASSYAELVPMGLYAPPWTYGAKSVALDVSYHLAYGLGTASGWRLLAGRD
jgi:hypothetical protein